MGATSGQVKRAADVGAYGLRLENAERARALLVPASPDWPRLRIQRKLGQGDADTDTDWLSDQAALIQLQNGGEISIERARGLATFVVPRPLSTAELVHPLLAPVAAVMGYWLGRESFHASGFVAGDGIWGLLGERGSGKSTMVARLALDGVPVVCDDLLVLDAGAAFAGPRSVDLRREAAEELGVGEALGMVGARERWRMRLGPAPNVERLAGWVFLTWGERVEAVRVPPAERLPRLHAQRGVNVPARDLGALLDLAALPTWELSRPPGWSSLPDAIECLLGTLG